MPSVALLERGITEVWALPSKGQSLEQSSGIKVTLMVLYNLSFLLSLFLMPQRKLPGKNDTVKCILIVYPHVIHSTNIY